MKIGCRLTLVSLITINTWFPEAIVSKNNMSATNINMTIPKPCMYYDCTYPFAGLKKPTAVDAEAIRNKQYKYSEAVISHGEKIEDVPEIVPKKKYMMTSVIDFFKQRQKFGRHPFLHTPNI